MGVPAVGGSGGRPAMGGRGGKPALGGLQDRLPRSALGLDVVGQVSVSSLFLPPGAAGTTGLPGAAGAEDAQKGWVFSGCETSTWTTTRNGISGVACSETCCTLTYYVAGIPTLRYTECGTPECFDFSTV